MCKEQLDKANKFIKADKMKVEKYQKNIEELKVFCSQYDTDDTDGDSSSSLQIVIGMYNKFKDHINDEKVDFNGIAKKLGIELKDLPTKMKELAEVLYSNSKKLAGTTISLVTSNPMIFIAGGGASILCLDVFVAFKNTYNLFTDKGHPMANELRDTAKNLEKELQNLELFSKCFNEHIEVNSMADQNKKLYDDEICKPVIKGNNNMTVKQISEVESTADQSKKLYDDDDSEVKKTVDQSKNLYDDDDSEVKSTGCQSKNLYDDDDDSEVKSTADQNKNLYDDDSEVKSTADQNKNLYDDEVYQPTIKGNISMMMKQIRNQFWNTPLINKNQPLKIVLIFIIFTCICIAIYSMCT